MSDDAIPVYFSFYWPGNSFLDQEGKQALEKAIKIVNFTEMHEIYELALKRLCVATEVQCKNHNIGCWKIPRGSIPVQYFTD